MRALSKKLLFIWLLPHLCWADAIPYDPCASLLAVLNRPTAASSVCTAKPWQVIIEMGSQYEDIYPNHGHQYNFPEAEVRFGLPAGNELSILPPSYMAQYSADEVALFGYTATVLSYKHQFVPIGGLVYGVQSLFTLPSGDDNFGSEGLGVTLNSLVNYNITKATSVSLNLGYSSLTSALNVNDGQRYNSFNPDVIIAWQPTNQLQFYAEVYGQTKTGPEASDGYNADAGIQYLITPDIEVDVEYGQRISGELGGYSHYYGAGGGVRF